MTLVSRYILYQFLRMTALCQAGAITLFLIAEFIERIDDLIEKKATVLDGFLYFAFKIPQLVVLSVPVTVLLACVLTLVLLSRGNEIIAMRACGASIYQVITPILAASLAISLLTFLVSEHIVPLANREGYYIWRVRIKKIELRSFTSMNKIWYHSEDNTIWHITHYDPWKDQMAKVTLYRLDEADRLTERVDADRAVWVPRDKHWRFERGIVHRFEPNGDIRQEPFRTAVFTLRDKPEDFEKGETAPEQMSFAELRRYIRDIRRSGVDVTRYVVDMWAKLSGPFVSFVLALVGVPFSLKSGRSGGVALGVATAVGIGACYLVLFYVGISLGHAGRLPPLVAAWGANAAFLAGGSYLITSLRS